MTNDYGDGAAKMGEAIVKVTLYIQRVSWTIQFFNASNIVIKYSPSLPNKIHIHYSEERKGALTYNTTPLKVFFLGLRL